MKRAILGNLRQIVWDSDSARAVFADMLDNYEFLNQKVLLATKALRAMSLLPRYRERFLLLRLIPRRGIAHRDGSTFGAG
jgi:hypothetical protein